MKASGQTAQSGVCAVFVLLIGDCLIWEKDANGNILNLNAYGAQLQMDQLTYQYYSGTNKLKRVEDDFATPALADDIENQTGDSEGNNYIYDGIGNLIDDKQENIEIDWTVYGKVKKVQKKDNSQTIVYLYDAAGNRTMKTVSRGSEVKTTYYVRDASGNVLSVYEKSQSTAVAQSEVYLYGSSRLGVYRPQGSSAVSGVLVSRQLQEKEYELVDHLGNVRAVIGDYRQADGTNPIQAALRSYANYYAFGMNMPGRNYSSSDKYRYGFNGKEIDKDFNGNNIFEYRVQDPRLGRFLTIDPLTRKFPELSPYLFACNSPIICIDNKGLSGTPVSAIQLSFEGASAPKNKFKFEFKFWDVDRLTSNDQLFDAQVYIETREASFGEGKNDTWEVPTGIVFQTGNYESGAIGIPSIKLEVSKDMDGVITSTGIICVTIAGSSSSTTSGVEAGAEINTVKGIDATFSVKASYSETINRNGQSRTIAFRFNAIYDKNNKITGYTLTPLDSRYSAKTPGGPVDVGTFDDMETGGEDGWFDEDDSEVQMSYEVKPQD